jgi:3-hydroxybutyryl-CoA dehydrogenase
MKIQTVAVLGAGTMGHGIAQVCAAAGRDTLLLDVEPEAVRRGVRRIEENLEKGVSLGKITVEDRELTLSRITPAQDLAATSQADLVIEAAPEDLDVKRSLFRALEDTVGRGTILATNTSSLSIDAIASGLTSPERFLGLHFFNPVHIMALVEVVRGSRTSALVLDAAMSFVSELGKEPIVVKDSPGFASSRLGVALGLEAMRMVEEGVAEPEAIDRAMELGYRHPMGPLRLTDLVGLDVRLGIAEYLHQTLGQPHFKPPEILRRMVAEGKLGKKTGRGFYDWRDS